MALLSLNTFGILLVIISLWKSLNFPFIILETNLRIISSEATMSPTFRVRFLALLKV